MKQVDRRVTNKVDSVVDALQKGKVIANASSWKNGQITVNILSGFLAALLAVGSNFGLQLSLTEEETTMIAGIIVSLMGAYNTGVTLISSEKVGTKN